MLFLLASAPGGHSQRPDGRSINARQPKQLQHSQRLTEANFS